MVELGAWIPGYKDNDKLKQNLKIKVGIGQLINDIGKNCLHIKIPNAYIDL